MKNQGSNVPGTNMTNSVTVANGSDLEVRKATISPGGSIPHHTHPFGQSHVVVAGTGFYMSKDGKVPVGPGFVNYSAAGEAHGWENSHDGEMILVSSSAGGVGVYDEVGDQWNIHYVQ